jgi:hypothetical protein
MKDNVTEILNKVNETESIALTQYIDTINYYINEFLF